MTQKSKFNLNSAFHLAGRGLVHVGDLIEGRVVHGNYITFNTSVENVTLKISAVEFADFKSRRRSEIGLMFDYVEEKKKY